MCDSPFKPNQSIHEKRREEAGPEEGESPVPVS